MSVRRRSKSFSRAIRRPHQNKQGFLLKKSEDGELFVTRHIDLSVGNGGRIKPDYPAEVIAGSSLVGVIEFVSDVRRIISV